MIFIAVMIFYSADHYVYVESGRYRSMEAMLKLLPQELIKAFGYQLAGAQLHRFSRILFLRFSGCGISDDFYGHGRASFDWEMVDNGSMAYLLATPNSRIKIVLTQAIVFVLMLALLYWVSLLPGIFFLN
jgi:ABC-2 type transport system permease protein